VDGLALLFLAIVFGIVGAAIGASRKNAGMGFVLGALLGPIGWIVTLFVDHRAQCPECKGRIPDGARKCLHCGSAIEMQTFPRISPKPSPPKPLENPVEEYKKWKEEHPQQELPASTMNNPVEEYKQWKAEKSIE
jgi:hypothetical protein